MMNLKQLTPKLEACRKWLDANDRARQTALGAGILTTSIVIGLVFPTVPVLLTLGFLFIAFSMFVGFIAETSYGFYTSVIEPRISKRRK